MASDTAAPSMDAGALLRWLHRGPIQDAAGGIVAWYDRSRGPAYVYPEVSGYYLTLAASAADGPDTDRERITRCCSYLAERVQNGRQEARAQEAGVVYNFDLGMTSTGLLRAYAVFGEAVADEGLQLAALLRDDILRHGHLPPWRAEGAEPQRGKTWSTQGFLHLAKCVQCLLLADEMGLSDAREAADVLVEFTLGELARHERPFTCPGAARIYLHPVLYCAEGLWMYHRAVNSPRAFAAASALLLFVRQQFSSGGMLPAYVDGARNGEMPREQSDVLAQLLRLEALIGGEPEQVERVIERLQAHRHGTPPIGAALEYRVDSGHLNTWATLFAAQAFATLEGGPAALPWRNLA